MASHGSLVISNNRWYWNRGGFGAVSALDYLIKVEGMDFVSAVEAVNGTRAAPSFRPLAVANPGFCLMPKDGNCKALAICEAPIDTMSHAVLSPEQDCYRLSLGGTSQVALMYFLENHRIDRLNICLDADDAGQMAGDRIQKLLSEDDRYSHIKLSHSPPAQGKDYNQMLQIIRKQEHELTGCQKASGFSI